MPRPKKIPRVGKGATCGKKRGRATAPQETSADQVIQELAAGQHGVVGRRQLLNHGLTSDEVVRRVRSGWLRRVHRGVYGVGPVVAPRGHLVAAILACGRGSWISHRSAGRLLGILPEDDRSGAVEITVLEGDRRHPRIRVHRTGRLSPEEITVTDGIRTTTASRTLFDLATVLPSRDLERAYRESLARRLTTPARVADLLARHRRRAGSSALRALVAQEPAGLTRSEAEACLLDLIRAADLPMPDTNARLRGFEVDFLWRRHRLIVEVDGFAFHSSRAAFEADRRRDATLMSAGYRVQRITWRRLKNSPLSVVANLAAALTVEP